MLAIAPAMTRTLSNFEFLPDAIFKQFRSQASNRACIQGTRTLTLNPYRTQPYPWSENQASLTLRVGERSTPTRQSYPLAKKSLILRLTRRYFCSLRKAPGERKRIWGTKRFHSFPPLHSRQEHILLFAPSFPLIGSLRLPIFFLSSSGTCPLAGIQLTVPFPCLFFLCWKIFRKTGFKDMPHENMASTIHYL